MSKKIYRKPTSPGEILWEEFLIPLKSSQAAFARHVGWTQPKVNEIITGKRGISSEAAMTLADALGTTPEFWLNAQLAIDLYKASIKHKSIRRLPQLATA